MFQSAKPFATLTAAEAVAEANAYVGATLRIERIAREQGALDDIEAARRVLALPVGPEQSAGTRQLVERLGMDAAQQLLMIVATAEAARRWKQHRVVYRVNRDLAESLLESDSKTPIPREVFTRLPHPNPFVAFPGPVSLDVPSAPFWAVAKPTELTGMLVTGADSHELPCDTSSPDLRVLRVSLSARVQYQEVGQAADYEEISIQLPVAGPGPDRLSIDDMVEAQLAHSVGQFEPTQTRLGFSLAVGLLLYLCSDQGDIQRSVNARARDKGASGRSAAKAKTVMDVGFDIGPRLAAARRAANSAHRSTSGTAPGSSPRAHLRRAHWHTYLTGPLGGPRTPIVKWISPIAVNAETRDPSRAQVIQA